LKEPLAGPEAGKWGLSEPNSILKNATMYFQTTSASGSLNEYDIDRIQFGYPAGNTPPYLVDWTVSVVTTSPTFGTLPSGVPGLNRFRVVGYDQQGDPLTPILVDTTGGAGEFSLSGWDLLFTPSGFFGAPRLTDADILDGISYGSAILQVSDGVNTSRVARCTVVGVYADRTPADGLPDDWMTANFGTTAVGALGSGRYPDDDPDGDGLSNRLEFQLNTDPNDRLSGPVTPVYDKATNQLRFTPVRFARYRIESSTTLENGSFGIRRVASMYPANQDIISDFSGSSPPDKEFFRVCIGF